MRFKEHFRRVAVLFLLNVLSGYVLWWWWCRRDEWLDACLSAVFNYVRPTIFLAVENWENTSESKLTYANTIWRFFVSYQTANFLFVLFDLTGSDLAATNYYIRVVKPRDKITTKKRLSRSFKSFRFLMWRNSLWDNYADRKIGTCKWIKLGWK